MKNTPYSVASKIDWNDGQDDFQVKVLKRQ